MASAPAKRAALRPRGKVLAVVVVLATSMLVWFTVRSMTNPYRAGTTLEAVGADCYRHPDGARGVSCWIQLGDSQEPGWIGTADNVPADWAGRHVVGTVHIIDDCADPSAEFTLEGTTQFVVGGRPSDEPLLRHSQPCVHGA